MRIEQCISLHDLWLIIELKNLNVMIHLIPFFKKLGWEVSGSFADNFDQGRDVGQKGMIFIHGKILI